ncbi:MAG: tetratricopeptide repeat protein [Kiritimatiellia bacterium]|jgi:hypothetical protein
MRRIEDRVSLAAQEYNRVALTIVREAKIALGQDIGIIKSPPRDLYEDTEKDWVMAVEKKAVDGDLFFIVIAGVLCYNGYANVPVDRQRGIALWQKAANSNCGLAKLRMGQCYVNGEVLPHDLKKAAVYFREAGELGVPIGWDNLGCLYNGWQGWSPRDLNKAMDYWAKSAQMGYAKSQFNLGFYYCNGDEAFPVNKELGIQWMRAAASNGHTRAISYLADYVDKKPAPRTLPSVIEDKSAEVVSTFIEFDKIKENVAGTKVSAVCFVDSYDPAKPGGSSTPSQMSRPVKNGRFSPV